MKVTTQPDAPSARSACQKWPPSQKWPSSLKRAERERDSVLEREKERERGRRTSQSTALGMASAFRIRVQYTQGSRMNLTHVGQSKVAAVTKPNFSDGFSDFK
jgi:hypothetical protein